MVDVIFDQAFKKEFKKIKNADLKDRVIKQVFKIKDNPEAALSIEAERNIKKLKEAKEIIDMASNYLSDAKHFETQGDFVNAFAALNYAHGWIDSGVRLGIFDVTNNRLFTIK